jgi:hypothetical protein
LAASVSIVKAANAASTKLYSPPYGLLPIKCGGFVN